MDDNEPNPVGLKAISAVPLSPNAAVASLLARRSVSPKRLSAPAPTRDMLDAMIDAASRAPDHGGLHPWRVIEFPAHVREALADLFEAEKKSRDPVATADDLARAREHATHAPAVLAFIVRPERHPRVPRHEQWLSAGAALGNLLTAAHLLGLGAIVLSGERCDDSVLKAALGVGADEVLAGFISIGTIAKAPPMARPVDRSLVSSCWSGVVAASSSCATAQASPAHSVA